MAQLAEADPPKTRYQQRKEAVERARARVVPAILRPRDVLAFGYVGSESALRRLRLAGTFPPAVRLGENSIGWRREDLDAWAASRVEA